MRGLFTVAVFSGPEKRRVTPRHEEYDKVMVFFRDSYLTVEHMGDAKSFMHVKSIDQENSYRARSQESYPSGRTTAHDSCGRKHGVRQYLLVVVHWSSSEGACAYDS